ncbi:MAG: hypothetical protein SH809_19645 [Rhodothermales bacterium]|nr:hypothetical protein [Rhodothermales bacterium]
MLENNTHEVTPATDQLLHAAEKKAFSRRSMLRAGWALPVIAAMPLMNTASAMSAFNCDRMFDKMIDSINSGDVEKAQKTLQQLLDNGCRF